MEKITIVAEKKTLAQDIADVLAKSYIDRRSWFDLGHIRVTWCYGHILEQQPMDAYDTKYARWVLEDLPLIPPLQIKRIKHSPKTKKPDELSKRQFDTIKELLADATLVYHCGDADREGQIIVDEVLAKLKNNKPVKRLWLHEQTPAGIKSALANMKDNRSYANLSLSAECRAESDWVIGLNGTRAFTLVWQKKGHQGVMNVGRVKSPVIGLVVQRELDIENFVAKPYYVVRATVKTKKGPFTAKWKASDKGGGETTESRFDDAGRLLDKKYAEAIVAKTQGKMGVIEVAEKFRKKNPPPLLFALGDLQRLAVSFGIAPDRTLEVAQALYNTHKLTSYPRTSCSYAPTEEWSKAAAVMASVKANFGGEWDFAATPDFNRKAPAWNDAKLDAHYAIIPTNYRKDLSTLSRDEQIIYRLIVRQWLAQFLPDYEYDSSTLTALVEGERFSATGQTPVVPGWRAIWPAGAFEDKDPDKAADAKQVLPAVAKGDPCKPEPVTIDTDKTKPPPRFNPATLLEAMEKAHQFVEDPRIKARLKETGIGTEATRSTIIAEIIRGEFIREEKVGKANVYVPTQKARAYYKALPVELAKVDLTAYFESQLEEIVQGRLDRAGFRTMLEKFMARIMGKIKDGSVLASMPTPAELPPEIHVGKAKGSGAGGKTRTKAGSARKSPPKAPAGTKKQSQASEKAPAKPAAKVPATAKSKADAFF